MMRQSAVTPLKRTSSHTYTRPNNFAHACTHYELIFDFSQSSLHLRVDLSNRLRGEKKQQKIHPLVYYGWNDGSGVMSPGSHSTTCLLLTAEKGQNARLQNLRHTSWRRIIHNTVHLTRNWRGGGGGQKHDDIIFELSQTSIRGHFFCIFSLPVCISHSGYCTVRSHTNRQRAAPDQRELGTNSCRPTLPSSSSSLAHPWGISLIWTLWSSSLTPRQQRQASESKLTVLIRGAMWGVISPLIITQTEKPHCNKQKGCHDCAAVNINQSDLDILTGGLLTGMLIMVKRFGCCAIYIWGIAYMLFSCLNVLFC